MSKTKMSIERYNEINSMAKETVAHWRDVVAGKLHYRTTIDCPACKKYLYQDIACKGCYIAEQTNSTLCKNTPIIAYLDLKRHAYGRRYYRQFDLMIELKVAAQDCLDFLIKLQEIALISAVLQIVKGK